MTVLFIVQQIEISPDRRFGTLSVDVVISLDLPYEKLIDSLYFTSLIYIKEP